MSLEISGLSFGYRRDLLFDALDAANLERGKLVALVGPNGVGKSSLFRLIAGFNAMRGGCISLDGQDLAGIAPRHRAERIFLLGQQVSIRAALGVFDVVLLARKGGRGGRAGRGDLAAVEDVLETLGIDDLADRPVTELSGGQQQLVSLAQALVRDPDVLLLDEPTSALDASVQAEILNLLMTIRRERPVTCVFVSHDLAVIAHLCDRVAVMQQGAIVEHLTADDLVGRRVQHPYTRQLLAASEGLPHDLRG
jgi:iron complex transport system ATP-binding protein